MALFTRLGMASPSCSPLTRKIIRRSGAHVYGLRHSARPAMYWSGNIAVASGGAAAAHARIRTVFVEELGEALEHDAAELFRVDDRDGAAVVARHVVADADCGQFHFAEPLDVVDHLAQVLFEVVAGVDGQGRIVDR